MSSPSPDLSFGTGGAAISSKTLSITVGHNSSILLVGVLTNDPSGLITVSSVAATGLTFSLMKALHITGATSQSGGSTNLDLELWSAPVTTSGSYSTTVTLSGTANCMRMFGLSVINAYSYTDAFDDDPTLPASNSSTSGAAVPSYSTREADDLLVAFFGTDRSVAPSSPPGWSSIGGGWVGTSGASSHFALSACFHKQVSTQLVGDTVSTASATGSGAIVVAVTADMKVVVTTPSFRLIGRC